MTSPSRFLSSSLPFRPPPTSTFKRCVSSLHISPPPTLAEIVCLVPQLLKLSSTTLPRQVCRTSSLATTAMRRGVFTRRASPSERPESLRTSSETETDPSLLRRRGTRSGQSCLAISTYDSEVNEAESRPPPSPTGLFPPRSLTPPISFASSSSLRGRLTT